MVRILFALLLSGNLAYAVVLYMERGAAINTDPYQAIKLERKGLAMLSELPAGKRPALREGVAPDPELAPWAHQETTNGRSSTVNTDGRRCLRVSRIDGDAALTKLRQTLRQAEIAIFGVGREPIRAGTGRFWVMLPPNTNQAEVINTTVKLKRLGIEDFFVVRSGEHKNAISLGIFSTRERAIRHRDQIIALNGQLGEPRIEAISQATNRFWLKIGPLKGTHDMEKLRATLNSGGVAQFREIQCKM